MTGRTISAAVDAGLTGIKFAVEAMTGNTSPPTISIIFPGTSAAVRAGGCRAHLSKTPAPKAVRVNKACFAVKAWRADAPTIDVRFIGIQKAITAAARRTVLPSAVDAFFTQVKDPIHTMAWNAGSTTVRSFFAAVGMAVKTCRYHAAAITTPSAQAVTANQAV